MMPNDYTVIIAGIACDLTNFRNEWLSLQSLPEATGDYEAALEQLNDKVMAYYGDVSLLQTLTDDPCVVWDYAYERRGASNFVKDAVELIDNE